MKVDLPRKNTDRWLMSNDQQPVVSGLLSLPRSVPGTVSLFEADAVLDSGATWRVSWDPRTRLAKVFDEKGEALGWTERTAKRQRQVVMANGDRPPVSFEDKLFSRIVWLEGVSCKPVMMLEGSKRIFGNNRLKLEHRDFTNEARFHCAPELLVAAVIVAFEVYGAGNCQAGDR